MNVHQLHERGLKISQIARKLKVSRTTVYKLLKRDPVEMAEWLASLRGRKKKLDPYETLIISWLTEYPDLSSSQISDWLLEREQSFQVGESTVRSYVKDLREKHAIERHQNSRQFEAVPELPMGKQVQVDFGTTVQRKPDGESVRLYCIGFVLSHSRYKFVRWLDRPFTTQDVIQMHELVFEAFGGIPEELVYDQDKLMLVSENEGDLVLTEAFQAYRESRQLNIYVCRKADPQTKGKIENVIKFVKHNFAKHRIFQNLEKWNEQSTSWLARTGNYRVHQMTKKRPVEVFQIEKGHLRPAHRKIENVTIDTSSITRTVRKDNTVLYRSNRYSVPLGTFKADKQVYLTLVDDRLVIREQPGVEPIAEHPVCHEKGKLIQNRQHTRDRSKGIQAYIETVATVFSDSETARHYLERTQELYPRYIRDQLQLFSRTLKMMDLSLIDETLAECLRRELYSANDFRDMADYLKQWKKQENQEMNQTNTEEIRSGASIPHREVRDSVPVRNIATYVSVLEGGS
ncbi:MAG: IS21 family transposase [Sporolactobacillus sp.]